MKQYRVHKNVNDEKLEEDEIIEVRKRKTTDGRIFGYELVTREHPDYPRPFVHKDWLNNCGEKITPFVRMLREYIKKHPELFILILISIFPQVPFLKDLSLLKSLLLKRIGN